MINTVVLSGRLTADPELRKTQSGVSVCSFTIANDTGYGENKRTNFVNIVAWRKAAEIVCDYCGKGSMIGIEGQIQMRKYEDKEGKSHNAFEVVANNVHFMESKKSESNTISAPADGFAEVDDSSDHPF